MKIIYILHNYQWKKPGKTAQRFAYFYCFFKLFIFGDDGLFAITLIRISLQSLYQIEESKSTSKYYNYLKKKASELVKLKNYFKCICPIIWALTLFMFLFLESV